MRADANWLLSTTVQSAAAFVAIVGGLLVSRLVALTSERSGLRTRREEAKRLLEVAEERLAAATNDLREVEADRATWAESETIFAAHGNVSAASITAESGWGADDPDVIARVEVVLSRVRQAFDAVGHALSDQDPGRVDSEDIEREVDRELRPFVADVLAQLTEEREARRSYGLGSIRAILPPRDGALIAADRQQREREYERVDEAVVVARRQRDDRAMDLGLADAALARVGRPEGIGWGFATLAYIGVTGIVLPLIVMLRGRTDIALTLRITVVGAFVSGLVVFGLYLRYVVRLLGR